jgi:hypothetical protein
MQALRNITDNNLITIGFEKYKVAVGTKPLEWECPVSIDVEAVDRIGDFQEEIASARAIDEPDDIFSSMEEGEQING